MPDDIEYVGLMAEAWDALRGDTSGWEDRDWFREVIARRGEPVLDVGTGTGRILLDFLAQGIDIEGVDNAPDMLERLHAKAAAAGLDVDGRVHLGRMQTLRLTRRYRDGHGPLVLVPAAARARRRGRGHASLLRAAAARRFARDAVHRHGQAVRRGAGRKEATLEDGTRVKRTARPTFDPAIGIEATDDTYEVFNNGDLLRTEHFVRPRATRAYSRDQARRLYETAGFVDLEWGTDFTFEDREPAEVFTIIGRRPD